MLEHSLRERLRGQLMLALVPVRPPGRGARGLPGRRAGVLVDDLGIEPRRELQTLEGAILRHDPALDRARAATPSPTAAFPERGGPRAELAEMVGPRRRYPLAGAFSCSPARPSAGACSPRSLRQGQGPRCPRARWVAAGRPAVRRSTGPGSRRCGPTSASATRPSCVRSLGPARADVARFLPELRELLPDILEPRCSTRRPRASASSGRCVVPPRGPPRRRSASFSDLHAPVEPLKPLP